MRDVPNPYAADAERREWFSRFTLTPVAPGDLEARLSAGESLATTDIPAYLSQKAHTDCETGVALYRLVQLWGTPNVPGRTAGDVRIERDRTTWQYLFDVEYDRRDADEPDVPDSFRLSVYDYKTDVSAGLSGFGAASGDVGTVHEPSEAPVPAVELPPEAFLVGVVGLVLNMVDQPVPATFKELWL